MGNRQSKRYISKSTAKDRAIAARFQQTYSILRDRSDIELKQYIETNVIPNYPVKESIVDMKMSHTDRVALSSIQRERLMKK